MSVPEEYPEGVGDEEREADVEREALGAPLAPDRHELRYVGDHASHNHRHLQWIYKVIDDTVCFLYRVYHLTGLAPGLGWHGIEAFRCLSDCN